MGHDDDAKRAWRASDDVQRATTSRQGDSLSANAIAKLGERVGHDLAGLALDLRSSDAGTQLGYLRCKGFRALSRDRGASARRDRKRDAEGYESGREPWPSATARSGACRIMPLRAMMGHSHDHHRTETRRALALGSRAHRDVHDRRGGRRNSHRSLALLADAAHMLSDNVSLGLALFAIWLASKPATPDKSFGYRRAEILAALANGGYARRAVDLDLRRGGAPFQ